MRPSFRPLHLSSRAAWRRELASLSLELSPELEAGLCHEACVVGGLDRPSAIALAGAMRYAGGLGEYWEQRREHGALLAGTEAQYQAAAESLVVSGRQLLADQLGGACRKIRQDRGATRCGDAILAWGRRTYVMGIVNVTPDSFSGDGLGSDPNAALEQAKRFVGDGADIIDVGGESTRPGHSRVSEKEEAERVLPVIELLAAKLDVPISIDTSKASVARRAIEAGAAMVNDIWGLRRDPQMAEVVAAAGVPVILMHNQEGTSYHNLMGDILAMLQESIDIALEAGISWENIIIDPGFGFGKTKDHNLEFMARLPELKALGRPILLGPSRKSTIGYILDLPVEQRMEGTAALVALGIAGGADIVRVHDVKEMVRVCRMADAVMRSEWR